MDLILAADLKGGEIVHGKSGRREEYRPIASPLASSAEPVRYLQEIRPRYLYIADLDRITGNGSHDAIIPGLADLVETLLLDRGCRSSEDMLTCQGVVNVVGTETAGDRLEAYPGGYLSVDLKDRRVLPDGADPAAVLARAGRCAFEGCIILDIGGVGTRHGLEPAFLQLCRGAYRGRLLWGGGVGTMTDLELLRDTGFDGAIIATALHTGAIPLDLIRSGCLC
jgi:phosphoribosylformimino-5-aminoimidazole carboxamide ribotide isomerase